MDRQRRSRYVLAVYLVVLSLAVILILAGLFFTASPDWKSVWINLGTGLLGVVVLFFQADDLMDFRTDERYQQHTLRVDALRT
jgi:RsiW-degrading membrane proteinase PrsW (M82 family)